LINEVRPDAVVRARYWRLPAQVVSVCSLSVLRDDRLGPLTKALPAHAALPDTEDGIQAVSALSGILRPLGYRLLYLVPHVLGEAGRTDPDRLSVLIQNVFSFRHLDSLRSRGGENPLQFADSPVISPRLIASLNPPNIPRARYAFII